MSDSLEFLLDENVRIEVMNFLKAKGYSAEYLPKGSTNHEVAELAKAKRVVFITHDTSLGIPMPELPHEDPGVPRGYES